MLRRIYALCIYVWVLGFFVAGAISLIFGRAMGEIAVLVWVALSAVGLFLGIYLDRLGK